MIRKQALIINLPGQPKAIRETLEGLKDDGGKTLVGGIFAAVPYCIDLIGGPYLETQRRGGEGFPPQVRDPTRKTNENGRQIPWIPSRFETGPKPAGTSSGCTAWARTATTSCRSCSELDLPRRSTLRFIFPHAPSSR